MAQQKDALPAGEDNAFADGFLRRLHQEDEPATALAAEYAGPWQITPLSLGGYAVHRWWESPSQGDKPFAVFADEQVALLAVAVLQAQGLAGAYRLDGEEKTGGFQLERGGRPAGSLRVFDENMVQALNLAEVLVSCPHALAHLLRAAGATCLGATGRVLARSLGIGAS